MEIYVGSLGYRYSDPMTTFVGLSKEAVDRALLQAIRWELREMPTYCDIKHSKSEPKSDCSLCNPDLVFYGVWPVYNVKELGGLRKTINYVKDARDNASHYKTKLAQHRHTVTSMEF